MKALKHAWHYFLWNRIHEEQRVCLATLRTLETASMQQIDQQTKLNDLAVHRSIQMLLRRDLVLRNEDDTYSIAAPIFVEWVERCMRS